MTEKTDLPEMAIHTSPKCFGCGADNSNGLNLKPTFTMDGNIKVTWVPDERHRGFKTMVHGGIICTLFDEIGTMACAVKARSLMITTGVDTQYRRPIQLGEEITAEAWPVEDDGRYVIAEAKALGPDGELRAKAKVRCIRPDPSLLDRFTGKEKKSNDG